MDATKPPGITLKGIILEKSNFRREAKIPEGFKNRLSFAIQPIISKDSKELNLFVTCTVNDKKSPIFAEFTYIGIYSVDESEPNLTLEKFLESGSALAIILPYIREEVSSRMQKSGLPQYSNVPLFNAMQIMKDLAGKKQRSSKNKAAISK
jgi:preprotein translocase subunit SecB